MNKKELLEQMARQSWNTLHRVEESLGFHSPEAYMLRSEWAAFDRAYQLVYEEDIHY